MTFRPVLIQLESFRAFRSTPPLEIRPLTFLVGQNSTGKTSFLAALNYMLHFQEGDTSPSLNQEPFDLGSFDQVAHKVGSRRSDSFSLSIEREININAASGVLAILWRSRDNRDPVYKKVRLELSFGNMFGTAQITDMDFYVGSDRLTVRFFPSPDFEIELDSTIVNFKAEEELPLEAVYGKDGVFNPRFITYMLNQAAIPWRESDAASLPENAGVRPLIQAFGCFLNSLPDHVVATAPIRSTPERVYTASERIDAPDGRATPYKLRRAKLADANRWKRLKSGFEEFGELAGLFNYFDIGRLTREEAGPFQVNVRVGKRKSSIADVGYGVSQTLPIVTDMIEAPDPCAFLFQQPEVHLHPRAQAGLGTFFAKFVAQHLNSFLVAETHSDYLIDRVRLEVRRQTLPAGAVSILYFEDKDDRVDVHQVELDSMGNVVDAPRCYRDFFFKEQMAILNLSGV